MSIGNKWELCCAINHWVETMMGYLGLKVATRKRCTITQAPGEWTGSNVRAIEGIGLFVTVSHKNCGRVKGTMESIVGQFIKANEIYKLDLKYLEQNVVFIV